MIDKFGRNINYLRISLTDRCNLKCVYCMPEDAKEYISCENLDLEDFKFIIKSMSELGITKVRFTGGEPLLYNKLLELIRFTREECNIEDIGITTNGIMLYEMAHQLKDAGLKNINISLDSLKEYKYKSITRGGSLKNVLRSIQVCLKLGFNVKINCIAIDGFNDDEIFDFINMTNYYPIEIRFMELLPVGEAKNIFKRGYIDIRGVLESIDGIKSININERTLDKYYKYKDARGSISVIAPLSNSFCKSCDSINITSDGKIKLCKNSDQIIDINKFIHKPLMFREAMKEILLYKPERNGILNNL